MENRKKCRAATELLDRTWGRPSQEVTVNRDTNVSVKFETFEDVQRGLQMGRPRRTTSILPN